MPIRNLWVERHEKYILVPLDGIITPEHLEDRINQGYTIYRVNLLDADLTEVLGQHEGLWTGMLDYLREAGKLSDVST